MFDEADKLLKYHNLKKLWLELKPLIQPLCGSKEELDLQKEVEEIILAFHKYDPTGQESRYTRTTKVVETLRNVPSRIDMKEVKCLIERVSNFFTGLEGFVSL